MTPNESPAALSFARDDIVLHKKTQHTYRVLGRCIIEATLADCYMYRGSDGRTWIRPAAEMEDGRFMLIESTDPAALKDRLLAALERAAAAETKLAALQIEYDKLASTAPGASETAPIYLLYTGGREPLQSRFVRRTSDARAALEHFNGAGRVMVVAEDHMYQAQRESDFPSAAHAKE